MEGSEWEQLEKAILKDEGATVKQLCNSHLLKYRLASGRPVSRFSQLQSGPCNLSAVSSRSADCVNHYYPNRIRSHSSIGLTTRRLSYQTSTDRWQTFNFPGGRKLSHSHPLQSLSSAGHSDSTQAYGATLTVYGANGIRSLPDTRRGSVQHANGGNNNENQPPSIFKNALHVAIQNFSFKALHSLLLAGLDPNASGSYDPCSAVAGVIGSRGTVDSPDCVHPLALLTIGACPSINEDSDSTAPHNNAQATTATVTSGSTTIDINKTENTAPTSITASANSRTIKSRRSSSIFAHLLTSNSRKPPSPKRTSSSEQQRHSITESIIPMHGFSNETLFDISSKDHKQLHQGFSNQHLPTFQPLFTQTPNLSFKNPSPQLQQRTISIDDHISSHYTIERLYNLPPIFLAVAMKNHIALRYLLRYEADPNIHDPFNDTSPLHLSVSERFYSNECAVLLVEHGAKVISTFHWVQELHSSTSCLQLRRCALYTKKQKQLLDAKITLLASCGHFIDTTRSGCHKSTSAQKSNSNHKLSSRCCFFRCYCCWHVRWCCLAGVTVFVVMVLFLLLLLSLVLLLMCGG